MIDPYRSIDIFAPYGRCEAAEMAFAVASVFRRLNCSVRYFGNTSEADGIHAWWDSRVIRQPWSKVLCLPAGCLRLWLFNRPTYPLPAANEIRLLSRLDLSAREPLTNYLTIACDSKLLKRQVVKMSPGLRSLLRVLPWCPEEPEMTPLRLFSKRIVALVDSSMLRQNGRRLCETLLQFLTSVSDVTVQLVLLGSSLPGPLLPLAIACEERTHGRLQIESRLSTSQRRQLYAHCDVVWLLQSEASPLFLQEAGEHFRPVIVPASSYSGKLIRHGQNGWLLAKDYLADLRELFSGRRWSALAVDDHAYQLLRKRRERFSMSCEALLDLS